MQICIKYLCICICANSLIFLYHPNYPGLIYKPANQLHIFVLPMIIGVRDFPLREYFIPARLALGQAC